VVTVLTLTAVAAAHVCLPARGAVSIPALQTSDLTATPTDNWITQEGNLAGNRYSGLTDISASNVHGLTAAWHVVLRSDMPEQPSLEGGEAPQLEYNGTLFAEDGSGRVYALNAATGAQIWMYEPHNAKVAIPTYTRSGAAIGSTIKITGPIAATRGLAMDDGMIYADEPPGKAVALAAATGRPVWSTQVASPLLAQSLSAAPVYYDGMILGATSGGDGGAACFAFALNARTGKLLWKFDVIPDNPGDPGYGTWTHPLAFDGGGAMWAAATVDPANGLVYFGTGNPIPYSGFLRGPGSEHFTAGTLALHASTGKLAWFFQEVHHDMWDADQSQQPMLATVTHDGQRRDAIVSAEKDGLWYVLDATTGRPIIPVTEVPVQQDAAVHTYPTQPIPQTDPLIPEGVPDPAAWTKLTAPDGKPYNIASSAPGGEFVAVDSNGYAVTAAGLGSGASGNKPASFDPTTGLMIEETWPGFSALEAVPQSEVSQMNYFNIGAVFNYEYGSLNGTPAASVSGTRLEAIDPSTGKLLWEVTRLAPGTGAASKTATPFVGGVLVSNGIIWTNAGSHLQALSEKAGKLLWSSPELPSDSDSPPTTYAVNGTQYVTTFLGLTGDLYAFALP